MRFVAILLVLVVLAVVVSPAFARTGQGQITEAPCLHKGTGTTKGWTHIWREHILPAIREWPPFEGWYDRVRW